MKKSLSKIVSAILLVILACTAVGCEVPQSVQSYTVTAVGGTGGGKFDSGSECTITATIADGKKFSRWTVGGVEVSKANPYKFTVSKDVTVTAEFKDIYTISVVGGKIGDKTSVIAEAGESLTAVADEVAGKTFLGWFEGETLLTLEKNYAFAASKNMTITTKLEDIAVIEKFIITVVGGTGSTEVEEGTEVTITATVPVGKKFVRWMNGTTEVSNLATYTFSAIANITLTAEFVELEKVTTPKNDTNQMFKYVKWNDDRNTTEFDRQKDADNKNMTAFVTGVDYLLYHVYTDSAADKNTGAIATFKLVKAEDNKGSITTMDGTLPIGCGNEPGNYFSDNTPKAEYFAFFKAVIGSEYDQFQEYCFAAQAIAIADTLYADSDISEIGTSKIRENAPIVVTVEGGTGSGKYASGTDCTVTATPAAGKYLVKWTVNGAEVSTANPYTFKVTEAVTVVAVYADIPATPFTVAVTGGTGGGEFTAGATCTITVTVPTGKNFIRWMNGDVEFSKSMTVSFRVVENLTLTAEFADMIQIVAPKNDANQMFKYVGNGDGRNTTEFDRQKDADKKNMTAFVTGVDYLLYHVYTDSAADKNTGAVATFKLVKDANGHGKITTMDGTLSIDCGTTPGNYYFDHKSKAEFFAFFKAVIGESFSETQNYYFAAQAIAFENTQYISSAISEVGTSGIRHTK